LSARRAAAASLAAILPALVLTACGDGAERVGASTGGPAAEAGTYALPSAAPGRFAFGAPASEARIAMWDIDVKPDGEGLPPGSGTVAQGEQVYMTQCLSCHGLTGVEGPYDRLVGTDPWEEWPVNRAIGNYWPYATTLYDYITRAMPQLTPGSLTADQTYAVIAYLLHLNGIVGEDAVMNAETLPAVQMPARDRFVMDDRTDGPTVK